MVEHEIFRIYDAMKKWGELYASYEAYQSLEVRPCKDGLLYLCGDHTMKFMVHNDQFKLEYKGYIDGEEWQSVSLHCDPGDAALAAYLKCMYS